MSSTIMDLLRRRRTNGMRFRSSCVIFFRELFVHSLIIILSNTCNDLKNVGLILLQFSGQTSIISLQFKYSYSWIIYFFFHMLMFVIKYHLFLQSNLLKSYLILKWITLKLLICLKQIGFSKVQLREIGLNFLLSILITSILQVLEA